jgi:hypothetical protein
MPALDFMETGMNTSQQFSSADLKNALIRKLNNLVPRLSAKMAAIMSYLLNTPSIEPRIVEIIVTSENLVLARLENEEAPAHFVSTYFELLGNWFALINAAGLTPYERAEALAVFAAQIGFIGQTTT